jgi:hypothetical protein
VQAERGLHYGRRFAETKTLASLKEMKRRSRPSGYPIGALPPVGDPSWAVRTLEMDHGAPPTLMELATSELEKIKGHLSEAFGQLVRLPVDLGQLLLRRGPWEQKG